MPTVLTQISSTAWEHPADRAALNTLRALPGFDTAVRKVAGFFGERGIRNLFQANAVRTGPTQRPQLDAMLTEVLETLDWPKRPQLFVTQTPLVNAAAVGFDEPFIVINSGLIENLQPDELKSVVAHEVGHIMSGHTTYRTIAIILIMIGINNLPFIASMALMPFHLALLEWYRKSELSSDRAALLGTQDPVAAMRTFMRLAGGPPYGDQEDLDAFLAQAREYEMDNNAWDSLLKVLNTIFRDHPFATVRAAELQRWIERGGYQTILDGTYTRRDTDEERNLKQAYKETADYYGDKARHAATQIEGMVGRATNAFRDAFRGPGNGGTNP